MKILIDTDVPPEVQSAIATLVLVRSALRLFELLADGTLTPSTLRQTQPKKP